jgi:hypothetical protein
LSGYIVCCKTKAIFTIPEFSVWASSETRISLQAGMEKIEIQAVDHKKDSVIVEFSNGQMCTFDVQFLLNHVNTNGNWDVTNISPEEAQQI